MGNNIVVRRKGRVLAFQALYSYDVGQVPLEDLLKLDWRNIDETEDANSVEEYLAFARILISGTINHIQEIDSVIKSHLSEKWEMGRINKVTLAILRMSVFSLLYQKDVSPPIIIDEAISISKKYGTDDAFKFINAILDKISKEYA